MHQLEKWVLFSLKLSSIAFLKEREKIETGIMIKIKEEDDDFNQLFKSLFKDLLSESSIPFTPPNDDYPFTILEDILILNEIINQKSLQSPDPLSTILQLKGKIIIRTETSIRSRFELLNMFTPDDYKIMYSEHLRHNRAEGFMYLEKEEDHVVIKRFALDFNKKRNRNQIKNIDLYDETTTNQCKNGCHKGAEGLNKKKSAKRKAENSLPECDFCRKLQKILDFKNNVSWPQEIQEDEKFRNLENIKVARSFLNGQRVILDAEEEEFEHLRKAVDFLKEKFKLNGSEIIDICGKVSGTMSSVEEYLASEENCQKMMVWGEADDEVLKKAKSADDLNFRLLLKYKGKERILKRLKFKEVELPFKFE